MKRSPRLRLLAPALGVFCAAILAAPTPAAAQAPYERLDPKDAQIAALNAALEAKNEELAALQSQLAAKESELASLQASGVNRPAGAPAGPGAAANLPPRTRAPAGPKTAAPVAGSRAVERENAVTLEIESTPDHPRNSEGAFATLKSGRVVFYYTQFYGGDSDFSRGRIVEIHSDDQGRSWSQPRAFAEPGDALSVMSVSLLRLHSGGLAMFYNIKRSYQDNHPYMRVSADEGATWSEPRPVISAPGYFSHNNDRVIQTSQGRLVFPVEYDRPRNASPNDPSALDMRSMTMWFLSDDDGATWRESSTWWAIPTPSRHGLQEPGTVELADGSLLSWARTDEGSQFGFRSRDGGENWTPPEGTNLVSPISPVYAPNATNLYSPLSPASIKRLPNSGALLAVYNDHSSQPFAKDVRLAHGYVRTPLVAAVSYDGGSSWPLKKVLEDDPSGEFCYTAIHFLDGAVLLAYNAGNPRIAHLGKLRIRRLARSWFPPTE